VRYIAGIDIGGTKCSISLGKMTSNGVELITKSIFPTQPAPDKTISKILSTLEKLNNKISPG